MADENNLKLISELLKKAGNDTCADCGAKGTDFFQYFIY